MSHHACSNVTSRLHVNLSHLTSLVHSFSFQFVDWIDKNYCISMFAPKAYPFDNLWVETGANPLVPSEKRPYMTQHIPVLGPNAGLQKC